MNAAIQALRPKQWIKNFLVFAAAIFTGSLGTPSVWQHAGLAFIAVSLVSSANYILNDLIDCERDRQHPKKKNRPFARGALSVQAGAILALLCASSGLGLAASGGQWLAYGVLGLGVVQVAYTFAFKHVPTLDLVILSMLYVLRAAIGGWAIQVPVSHWLLFCTGMLALFLAVAKRRQELLSLGVELETREVLKHYSKELLDALFIFAAALTVMSYGIYAIQSPTALAHPRLIATVPVVVYGVLRYIYLVLGQHKGEEPESVIMGDRHMIVTLLAFVATAVFAMAPAA